MFKEKASDVTAPAVPNKWRLEGYDPFESGPDAFYPLDGEYLSEAEAEKAARDQLADLEETQPSVSSGGQDGSIQDQVFIVGPDGKRRRYQG